MTDRLLVVDLAAISKNWALTPEGERRIREATPPGWRIHVVTAPTSSDGDGPPLCAVDDFSYRPARIQLRPGDMLCVVSDGLTEAVNASGELFGAARVERSLASAATARAAVDALRRDVASFVGAAAQADDQTVLALQWRGVAPKEAVTG